jgi:hypothetical protein
MVLENAPLLNGEDEAGSEAELNGHSVRTTMSKGQVSRTFRLVLEHLATFRILYIIGVFAFIIDTSLLMGVAPTTRLLELGICREYYRAADPSVIGPGGDVPELLCKVGEVQSRLAEVNGWLTMVAFLPSSRRPASPMPLEKLTEIARHLSRCAVRHTRRHLRAYHCLCRGHYRSNSRISLALCCPLLL